MRSAGRKKFLANVYQRLGLGNLSPVVRRVLIAIIGGTIVVIGIALIVLPGPAFLVVPLGLAVLATEFVWARRWLVRARVAFRKMKRKIQGRAA
jgi:uncharacterized protein (TIGR02611 family)